MRNFSVLYAMMKVEMHDLPSEWKGIRGFELFKTIWSPFIQIWDGETHGFRFTIDKQKEDAFATLVETPIPFMGRLWVKLNDSPWALAVGVFGGMDLAVRPNVGFENDIIGKYLRVGENILYLKYVAPSVAELIIEIIKALTTRRKAEVKSLFGYRNFYSSR